MPFTEANFENAIIELMRDNLGYNYIYGPDVERDYHSLLYEELMFSCLQKQAQSLCHSILTKTQRFEAAFFEAVRTSVTRITGEKKLSLKEINERINELLKHSIKSEGIINLFANAQSECSKRIFYI